MAARARDRIALVAHAGFPRRGLRRHRLWCTGVQVGKAFRLDQPARQGPARHAYRRFARLLSRDCRRDRRLPQGRRRPRADPGRRLALCRTDRAAVECTRAPAGRRAGLVQQQSVRLRQIRRHPVRQERQSGARALARQRLPELQPHGLCPRPGKHRIDRRRLDQYLERPGRPSAPAATNAGGAGRGN